MKRLLLLCASLAMFAIAAPSAPAATVVNGNFENGLDGWTVTDEPGSSGSWLTYVGTTPPNSPNTAPASIGTSAIADMTGETSTAITQDIFLPAGESHFLDLRFWYQNYASWFIPSPLSFSTADAPNQNFVIDVIKPTADPFTANPADILSKVTITDGSQPTSSNGWIGGGAELSAFAGQTVRLRAVDVNTENFLLAGLDEVKIVSRDIVVPTFSRVGVGKSKITTTGKGAGTTFTTTTSEAGTLRIDFAAAGKGKRRGGACVKPSKKLAKKKNCTRWTALKQNLSLPLVAGLNKIAFDGKVGGKALKPGKYQLTFSFYDAAGNGALNQTTTVTVVKPKKRKKR